MYKIFENFRAPYMSLIKIFVNVFMKPIRRYTKKNFQYKNTAKFHRSIVGMLEKSF